MRFLFIFIALWFVGPALAQGNPGVAPDASVASAPSAITSDVSPSSATQPVSAPASAAPKNVRDVIGNPDAPVSGADVLDAAKGAGGAIQDAMQRPTLIAVAVAISAALWAILAALRRFGGSWLNARAMRLVTLIAAPVLTFIGAWASGVGWFDAMVLAFGGGPGAMLLNEFGRAVAPKSDAAPAPPAT